MFSKWVLKIVCEQFFNCTVLYNELLGWKNEEKKPKVITIENHKKGFKICMLVTGHVKKNRL